MNDVQPGDTPASERVGDRLRRAREAQDLSLAELGQRTRIPLRHLEAIEATDFGALPSPTYAVGFARAHARAVGVDEVEVAQAVRGELARVPRAPQYAPYETADPDRVPSRGVATIGAGLALAFLILAGLWYATDLFRPGPGSNAGTMVAAPVAAPTAPLPAPVVTPTVQQVRLAAGDTEVWLRVYDAANKTLYLGTLKPGEGFDVPPGADGPRINVGRPDQLRITLNGSALPPLGDGSRPIKDVKVDAASLAARAGGNAATPAAAVPDAAALTTPADQSPSQPVTDNR
jgi:transcriptional regulator with XRE-family HTH domain